MKYIINISSFLFALIKSCLTSDGAADAVKIEIMSFCVENRFTHVVYSRLTTKQPACFIFFIHAGSKSV